MQMVVDAGLVLGGDYARPNGSRRSYLLRLDLLGSYPHVLDACSNAIVSGFEYRSYSRLLCPLDVVPLGTAVALRTGLPLVYSRGTREAPAVDLVGAYDIGHKTLLLLNDNTWDEAARTLIPRARNVGLDVSDAVALVDVGGWSAGADLACQTMMGIEDLLEIARLRR
jgi:hypothetical protein